MISSLLSSAGVQHIVVASDIPEHIEVDGKQRPTRNSSGRLIYPTLKGIENFWRWFGDSKLVDKRGRPCTFLHGTASTDINTFKGDRGFSGHFTECPMMANEYADRRDEDARNSGTDRDYGDAANVYIVYLKATTIFDARVPAMWESIGVAPNTVYAHYECIEQHYKAIGQKYDSAFDFEDDEEDEDGNVTATGIAVFSPNQIKSALGNNGNFDPNKTEITAGTV